MVTRNQNIHVRDISVAQQRPLSERISVSCDEYITFFRIKQDTQTHFIFCPMESWGKDLNNRIAIPDLYILCGNDHLRFLWNCHILNLSGKYQRIRTDS